MTSGERADPATFAMWGGGALLLGLGQLALPFTSLDLFVGRGSITVWDLPASFALGEGSSVLRQFANRATELWLGPGAVVATVVVIALVVAVVVGRVPRYLPAVAAWVATAWQVGSYLTLATLVSYTTTPRPGLGLVASVVGATLISIPLFVHRIRSSSGSRLQLEL